MDKTKTEKKNASLYLGLLLVTTGILSNKWLLEWLLADDGKIESAMENIIIAIFQIVLILAGLFLILKRPKLPSKKELVLLSISILLPFLLLELGARFWLNNMATPKQYGRYVLYTKLAPEQVRWHKHHYLNYYPAPGYKLGPHYHNSLGYRNEEFSREKPAGTYRIVALGGSSTYTVSVRENTKTFTYQLEKVLANKYGIDNIEVINAGASGYDSWESLINLQFRVLDLNPDLIIVYHGVNDVHARFVVPTTYQGDNSGLRKQWTPPKIRLYEYSTLLRIIGHNLGIGYQVGVESFVNRDTYLGAFTGSEYRAAQYDKFELLEKNPPVYFRRNLVNMVAIAKANGIDAILSTWAHSSKMQDYAASDYYRLGFKQNNEVVREVANQTGALLFDFATVMPEDPEYWSDGRHVNEAGAALKAGLFADYLHGLGIIKN